MIEETLAPYLKKLIEGGIKSAEELAAFIEVQTPILAKEIIVWGAISESGLPFMCLLGIFVCSWIHLKYRKDEKYYAVSPTGDPPAAIVVILATFVLVCVFVSQIMDVIYPLAAPRLYTLEKVSKIIK